MSVDVSVFHSDEADDPAALPGEGWYVGNFDGSGTLVADGARGPYRTKDAAVAAMLDGVWI